MPPLPTARSPAPLATDALAALLARHLPPVAPADAPARRLALSLALGAAGALVLLLAGWGLRADLADAARVPMLWFKLAFAGVLVLSTCGLLGRLSRPGRTAGGWLPLTVLPFVALATLVAVGLAGAAPGERTAQVLGATWRTCAPSLLALSLPTALAAGWALRRLAPTRLAAAGAAAGALGGGVAVAVYSLHCPEMAPGFMVWYGAGALLPAVAGALVGPRWLRW
jgi:hypothetical protein